MPSFIVPLPQATDPARVDAWLDAHGFVRSDGSAVNSDGTVTVSCDQNPATAMAAYVDAPTAKQQARTAAIAAVQTYLTYVAAIPIAARSQEQKLLVTLISLLPGVTG